MRTRHKIYILHQHGNTKKKGVAPDGGKDEDVFGIQQCVAIRLMIKYPEEALDSDFRRNGYAGNRVRREV